MSDIIPINKNHSDLVKFTEDCVDYAIIVQKLRELTESVLPQIWKPTADTLNYLGRLKPIAGSACSGF
jgi:hypothetical protein